jgi:hypothetical protein
MVKRDAVLPPQLLHDNESKCAAAQRMKGVCDPNLCLIARTACI